jgi:sulfur carrier protein ThiS
MIRTHSFSGWWVLGGIIVAVVALFLLGRGGGTSGKTNREVALTCTTDMATQFHIHPHLQILVNGQPQEIPANVGVTFTCMNALHTHDATGKIHVESPEKRDFTLADFFAVWNKPFSKDQILDYKVDDTHTVRVTVNGKEVDTYEHTVLRDMDQIVISYEGRK